MKNNKKGWGRWRTTGILALGAIIGTMLLAPPAGAHFLPSISHIWHHIKPKADARYANAVPHTDKAKNADKVDGRHANQLVRAATDGGNTSVVIAGTSTDTDPTTLNTVSINAPKSGALLVSWSAWQTCAGAEIAEVKMYLDGTGDDSFWVVPSCSGAGDFRTDSFQSLVPVSVGAHSLEIRADDFNGGANNMSLSDSRLDVLYVPFNGSGGTAFRALSARVQSASKPSGNPGG
jgi:hypothetical protein